MAEVETKKGRPKKAPAAKKKSVTKQIPLTFKCKNELEMDLYNHLESKYYRGAYIKELLIRQMFAERPDIAKKYGNMVQEPAVNYSPTVEVVKDDPVVKADPVVEVDSVEVIEDDPLVEDETPPKITRGGNTLNMF